MCSVFSNIPKSTEWLPLKNGIRPRQTYLWGSRFSEKHQLSRQKPFYEGTQSVHKFPKPPLERWQHVSSRTHKCATFSAIFEINCVSSFQKCSSYVIPSLIWESWFSAKRWWIYTERGHCKWYIFGCTKKPFSGHFVCRRRPLFDKPISSSPENKTAIGIGRSGTERKPFFKDGTQSISEYCWKRGTLCAHMNLVTIVLRVGLSTSGHRRIFPLI